MFFAVIFTVLSCNTAKHNLGFEHDGILPVIKNGVKISIGTAQTLTPYLFCCFSLQGCADLAVCKILQGHFAAADMQTLRLCRLCSFKIIAVCDRAVITTDRNTACIPRCIYQGSVVVTAADTSTADISADTSDIAVVRTRFYLCRIVAVLGRIITLISRDTADILLIYRRVFRCRNICCV